MKEFVEMLKQRVAENPPNYGDADSILGLLYECFNENNPYDNDIRLRHIPRFSTTHKNN